MPGTPVLPSPSLPAQTLEPQHRYFDILAGICQIYMVHPYYCWECLHSATFADIALTVQPQSARAHTYPFTCPAAGPEVDTERVLLSITSDAPFERQESNTPCSRDDMTVLPLGVCAYARVWEPMLSVVTCTARYYCC